MTTKEIREMSADEIKKSLDEKRAKMRSLSFDMVSKQVKNNKELRRIKKETAQLLTILRERELGK